MRVTLCLLVVVFGLARTQVIRDVQEGSGGLDQEVNCDFQNGVCDWLHVVGSKQRLSIKENTDGGKYLAFSAPEDSPVDREVYTRVTLGKLAADQSYCLTISYSLTGSNTKHIILEQQPSEKLEDLQGEDNDWEKVQLSLSGQDKLVRLKLMFSPGSFGDINIADVTLSPNACE
ncbi:nephronectin-like [Lineus longissimus]|uniref:nephronectin-like n=1 Tax=Lineus longissimus TaxID=88925 RepID=UPI002B4DF2D2